MEIWRKAFGPLLKGYERRIAEIERVKPKVEVDPSAILERLKDITFPSVGEWRVNSNAEGGGRLILVFPGMGFYWPFSVGFLDRWREEGMPVDATIGISGGSIGALSAALHYNGEDVVEALRVRPQLYYLLTTIGRGTARALLEEIFSYLTEGKLAGEVEGLAIFVSAIREGHRTEAIVVGKLLGYSNAGLYPLSHLLLDSTNWGQMPMPTLGERLRGIRRLKLFNPFYRFSRKAPPFREVSGKGLEELMGYHMMDGGPSSLMGTSLAYSLYDRQRDVIVVASHNQPGIVRGSLPLPLEVLLEQHRLARYQMIITGADEENVILWYPFLAGEWMGSKAIYAGGHLSALLLLYALGLKERKEVVEKGQELVKGIGRKRIWERFQQYLSIIDSIKGKDQP